MLTDQLKVVVARSNELRLDMRHRKDIHCCRSSPPHRRTRSHVHPMGGYRRDFDHRPRFLVFVDPSMPTCVILLAASSTGARSDRGRPRSLLGPRYYHWYGLCLQCYRYLL
jgi:hypothetical protein